MYTKEIEVPTQWSEVTVLQYQQLQMLDLQDGVNEKKHTSKIINILCDLDDSTELPIEIFNQIAGNLVFLKDEIKAVKKKELFVDGKLYRWFGNFNQLTAGEVISVEQIIDIEGLNYSQSFDVIAAVLLREVKNNEIGEFKADKFNRYRDLFGEIPITELYGMCVFFLTGGHLYIKNLSQYLVITKTITITTKRSKLSKIVFRKKHKLTMFLNGLRLWISLRIKTSPRMTRFINKTT